MGQVTLVSPVSKRGPLHSQQEAGLLGTLGVTSARQVIPLLDKGNQQALHFCSASLGGGGLFPFFRMGKLRYRAVKRPVPG